MRVRLPGFGFALTASYVALASGCAGAGAMKMGSAEAAPAPPMAAPVPGLPATAEATSAPTDAAMAAPAEPTPGAPSEGGGATRSAASAVAVAPSREMLDIEAHVTLRVAKVKTAVKALHELAARLGGVITAEQVSAASQYASAELTLRVPSGSTQGVLQALDGLGKVTDQSVTARDIGKEYFDANLRLSSLETTLRRYEEILTHATKVEEILRIEQELGRLRAEIEQVKGNLRWLKDRAARSTIHLHLSEEQPQLAYTEEPDAKFFPGLRAVGLLDIDKQDERGYAGGGLSIRASRAFSVDLDLLKRFDSEARGPDVFLATLGGELFSDRLGGGDRRYLNPYLGWRAGYARFESSNQALVGVTLGLELVKTRYFVLDAEARNYLIGGGARGFHYGLTPALGAAFAF